ncbi:MAG: mRNA interferase MazF9 [Acidimicrobiia bacterium BACL6 MAG-121220-bin61]|nr:MAG: mRNA interferase MazF9 [Acidimicrobiia bacterium BACL6 MAG-120910-bin40]KRO66095.1 MAG: mRNA interferase MazF9 [Acidimicrobiia bacterium BACL6 MAG-121220-bin61]
MLRGEIRLVNLEPALSGESNKVRPAVVVSNDVLNNATQALDRGVVTVVPITSNVLKVYPFQVHLPCKITGLDVDSKAQIEQIRAVAISRIGRRVGRLTADLEERMDAALTLHLAL